WTAVAMVVAWSLMAPTVSGGCSSNVPRQVGAPGAVQGLARAPEAERGVPEVRARVVPRLAGEGQVALDLVERGVPAGQPHHDGREGLGVAGIAFGPVEVAAASGGDGGGHGERDPAAGAGLPPGAHGP